MTTRNSAALRALWRDRATTPSLRSGLRALAIPACPIIALLVALIPADGRSEEHDLAVSPGAPHPSFAAAGRERDRDAGPHLPGALREALSAGSRDKVSPGGGEGPSAPTGEAGQTAPESGFAGVLADLAGSQARALSPSRLPVTRPVRGARLTSPYGMRRNPITGRGTEFHPGIDLAVPTGTPVVATADGVVTYAGWQQGYGKVVKLRHAFGIDTVYGHLSHIDVEVGQRVSRDEELGAAGSTGRSTGPHVFYQIYIGGSPIDPLHFIPAGNRP